MIMPGLRYPFAPGFCSSGWRIFEAIALVLFLNDDKYPAGARRTEGEVL